MALVAVPTITVNILQNSVHSSVYNSLYLLIFALVFPQRTNCEGSEDNGHMKPYSMWYCASTGVGIPISQGNQVGFEQIPKQMIFFISR